MIKLNDKYFIDSDPLNIILKKKTDKKEDNQNKEDTYSNIGYYSDIETAFKHFVTHYTNLNCKTMEGLKSAIEEIKVIQNNIKLAL